MTTQQVLRIATRTATRAGAQAFLSKNPTGQRSTCTTALSTEGGNLKSVTLTFQGNGGIVSTNIEGLASNLTLDFLKTVMGGELRVFPRLVKNTREMQILSPAGKVLDTQEKLEKEFESGNRAHTFTCSFPWWTSPRGNGAN